MQHVSDNEIKKGESKDRLFGYHVKSLNISNRMLDSLNFK